MCPFRQPRDQAHPRIDAPLGTLPGVAQVKHPGRAARAQIDVDRGFRPVRTRREVMCGLAVVVKPALGAADLVQNPIPPVLGDDPVERPPNLAEPFSGARATA